MKNFMYRLKKLYENRFISIYLFRYYKYKVYPKLHSKPRIELLCINRDGIKYEIVFKSQPINISFNNKRVILKKYSKNRGFLWIENTSGTLKIDKYQFDIREQERKILDKESIIIICDRMDKADDNGEFLYQWVLKNNPDFTNIYFAISSNSGHYKRLQEKGFNLLDTRSKEFRVKYQKADAIVSSVYSEALENHRQLRYKLGNAPKSKFICLQHGIIYKDDSIVYINAHQKINYFITSLAYEKELLDNSKVWFSQQTPSLGMSRFMEPIEKDDRKTIIYMPSWTAEAVAISNIEESRLYQSIKSITSSKLIKDYLISHNLQLKVVIHPQLGVKSSGFINLASENIEVVSGDNISYRTEIANCLLLITDYSSVFFDGLFYKKPIAFYQPDKSFVPNLDIFNDVGKVMVTDFDLVKYLETLRRLDYRVPVEKKFVLQDVDKINQNIWELIING